MEWIIGFIKRLTANVVAFVVICAIIAVSPLISIVVVVAMEIKPRNGDLLAWFIVACPFCVGIWYMFIASLTRNAQAKYRVGVSPRNGFLWAGVRLFSGWFLSQAIIVGLVLIGSAIFGDADGSIAMATQRVHVVAPVFLLAAWSPVLVNLTRHFMRRYPGKREIRRAIGGFNGTSLSSPTVGL